MGVARAFANLGYRIALVGRNQNRLSSLSEELNAIGASAFGFAADAGNESSLRAALRAIREHAGDTEVLLYNAVAFRPGSPSALGFNDLISDFSVNVAGAVVAVNEVLPAMRAHGAGTILLTGGGLALQPAAPVASLSIGKAGIRSLALSLFSRAEAFRRSRRNRHDLWSSPGWNPLQPGSNRPRVRQPTQAGTH